MEMNKPTYVDFEKDKYPWKPDIDYRENPHLYKIGCLLNKSQSPRDILKSRMTTTA